MAGAVAWMVFAYAVVIDALLGTMSLLRQPNPFRRPRRAGHHSVRPPGPVLALRAQRVPAVLPLADGSVLRLGSLARTRSGRHRHPDLRRERAQHLSLHAPDPLPLLAASGSRARAGHGVRRRLAGRHPAAGRRHVRGDRGGRGVVHAVGPGPVLAATLPPPEPDQPAGARHQHRPPDVPPSAVVSAYYPYVAHLDHRTRIYQWPTPFRATYWGLYTQEGQRLPFAGRCSTWCCQPTLAGWTSRCSTRSPTSSSSWVRAEGSVSTERPERGGPDGGSLIRQRLTWSLTPHLARPPRHPVGPAGDQDLLLSRTMISSPTAALRGSFRLRLASTFNHRPAEALGPRIDRANGISRSLALTTGLTSYVSCVLPALSGLSAAEL